MDRPKMLKPTVLSLSLLTIVSTGAVAPALGEIGEFFASSDRTLVQLVAVMHAVALVPSLLLAGRAAERFSAKKAILGGLVLFSVSGIAGGFANNIWLLLFSRLLMGVGLGMVIPFSTSLISDLYEGEERTRMMGLSNSFNMLGGMFALALSGQLAFFSWRLPFLLYASGVPVMMMVAFFLPGEVEGVKDLQPKGGSLPRNVYFVALGMYLFCVLFFILTPTLALHMKNNALGDVRVAGVALSFSTIGGFASGFVLPVTKRVFKKYLVPVMLTAMGAGFIVLSWFPTSVAVFAASLLIGFANRSVYPLFFLKATERTTPGASVKATALLSAMIYLGQFTAPPFQRFVGVLSGRSETGFLYLFVALVTLTVALALFVRSFFRLREETVTERR